MRSAEDLVDPRQQSQKNNSLQLYYKKNWAQAK